MKQMMLNQQTKRIASLRWLRFTVASLILGIFLISPLVTLAQVPETGNGNDFNEEEYCKDSDTSLPDGGGSSGGGFGGGSFGGQQVPVIDQSNLDVNTATLNRTTTIVELLTSLVCKEYKLDPEAAADTKVAVANNVKAIIETTKRSETPKPEVDSVVEGEESQLGTTFEQKPLDYYANVAKKVLTDAVDDYDQASDQPFKRVLQRIITSRENRSTLRPVTQLDDATGGNSKDYLAGDFDKGGWDAWYTLTQNPDDNPYTSILKTEQEIKEAQAYKVAGEKEKLAWGEGFHPVENAEGEITTPSIINRDQIVSAIESCRRVLEATDEAKEAVNLDGDPLEEMCNKLEEGLSSAEGLADLPTDFIDNLIDMFDYDFGGFFDDVLGDLLGDAGGIFGGILGGLF